MSDMAEYWAGVPLSYHSYFQSRNVGGLIRPASHEDEQFAEYEEFLKTHDRYTSLPAVEQKLFLDRQREYKDERKLAKEVGSI